MGRRQVGGWRPARVDGDLWVSAEAVGHSEMEGGELLIHLKAQ